MKRRRLLEALLQAGELAAAYILGSAVANEFFSGTFWQGLGCTVVFIVIFAFIEGAARGINNNPRD